MIATVYLSNIFFLFFSIKWVFLDLYCIIWIFFLILKLKLINKVLIFSNDQTTSRTSLSLKIEYSTHSNIFQIQEIFKILFLSSSLFSDPMFYWILAASLFNRFWLFCFKIQSKICSFRLYLLFFMFFTQLTSPIIKIFQLSMIFY